MVTLSKLVDRELVATVAWAKQVPGMHCYFQSCTASVPPYPYIQRVETFKLLGIVVSNDLKWNPHISYIIHKANSRLHLLRQIKRAAVPRHDMLHFYIAVIHPVLEYAVPAWHTGLTADLFDPLETVQK